MKQCINLLINDKEINNLRKRYDKFYRKFKTHLTLVYPFEVRSQKQLYEHIKSSITKVRPFKLKFGKFYASKEFVCLEVRSKQCWKLYKNLNNGILAGFKNKEVKFRPHISLAVMNNRNEAAALAKVLYNKKKRAIKIDRLSLITLQKDNTIKSKKIFRL